MADPKKSCCNRSGALAALAWVNDNRKTWSVLFIIADIAPVAIIRAVDIVRGRLGLSKLSGDPDNE